MEKQELNEKIKKFLKNKHFENPFIQECITEFIEGHTSLYGDVISADDLIERLETNLDKITFAGQENAPNGELGEYKGRVADNTDLNEIVIYFSESNLELSETDKKMWSLYTDADKQKLLQDIAVKKAEIKSTIIHELTHSAYTIKGERGFGEKHIFSETSKDYLSGEYRQIGGNYDYVEAIVNYISNRIEGKNPDEIETYQAETKAIYMLAEKVNEKSIIQSAWLSDEQQLKQAYITAIGKDKETGEKSYTGFQEGIKRLRLIRRQNISISENILKNKETLSEIQQILDGKSFELESTKIKDIEHIKSLEDIGLMNVSEKEEKMSFIQKIANFLSRHKSLINVPFIKKFVDKQLNILPPAKSEPTLDTRKINFINEISNNGEYRKIKPIQKNKETQIPDRTTEKTIENNER